MYANTRTPDLDLGLHVLDGVAGLHLERDGLAGQRLDEDCRRTGRVLEVRTAGVHGTAEPRSAKQHASATASTVGHVHPSRSKQRPPTSLTLHAAAQAQHQVQRALLLDVVVGQRAAVLELLAGEDQALLVRGDACSRGVDDGRE